MGYLLSRIFVTADMPECEDHWQCCIARKQPHIVIRPEGDKKKGKYAKVEYDLFPCMGFGVELNVDLLDILLPIYRSYCGFYLLPEKQQASIGGSVALSFRVFREHAEAISEQLFKYLEAFIREQQSSGVNIYPEAMAAVTGGDQGLRFVLDPQSAEFGFATDERRMSMMQNLVSSGYTLYEVLNGYVLTYRDYKPHVADAVRDGLLYNIQLWQMTYPDEEDYSGALLSQTGDRELTEILEEKILSLTVN